MHNTISTQNPLEKFYLMSSEELLDTACTGRLAYDEAVMVAHILENRFPTPELFG